mgnify:FL=1
MREQEYTISERLTFLATAEPVEPYGWFRWVFDRYSTRCMQGGVNHGAKPFKQGWTHIAKHQQLLNQPEHQTKWLPVLERHAWTAGMFAMTDAVQPNWERMSPVAKGLFMAGVSRSSDGYQNIDQVIPHIHEGRFTNLAFCQLACNLIYCQKTEFLEAIFSVTDDWTTPIEQLPAFDYDLNDFSDIMPERCRRPIDIVLEAALFWESAEGIKQAALHGANLDMPVLSLERSSNEQNCPLSYVLAEGRKDLAELLLELGASPEGTDYAGKNAPLFRALRYKTHDMAEKLLDRGISLAVPATYPHSNRREYFWWQFGCNPDDMSWVEQTFSNIIPFVPLHEKQLFYDADAQAGSFHTLLTVALPSLEIIKRCEANGLDTRLTALEFCIAVKKNTAEALSYLLERYAPDAKEQVFQLIKLHKPEFQVNRQN